MDYGITKTYAAATEAKPMPEAPKFGTRFTAHMFMMDYETGAGWHDPRIVPYGPITLDPAAKVFHYGQTVFEGMKAFWTPSDGSIRLFRPDANIKRLNRSCQRLSIPPLDEGLVLAAIKQLVQVDRDWMPEAEGTSLYIRPFIIATEPVLGVAPSLSYRFMIILSPVGAYYAAGMQPVSIYVEPDYVRAVAGGVGDAKTAGNYAGGLKAQEEAAGKGYEQVMWLDGIHRRYIEEVGSMNVFFRFGDVVATPALNGSILAGITRDSIIRLLSHWQIRVEERPIAIDEVISAMRSGEMREAFGTGTAASVSPIGTLHWEAEKHLVGAGSPGELTLRLYEALNQIQRGTAPDPFGWMEQLD